MRWLSLPLGVSWKRLDALLTVVRLMLVEHSGAQYRLPLSQLRQITQVLPQPRHVNRLKRSADTSALIGPPRCWFSSGVHVPCSLRGPHGPELARQGLCLGKYTDPAAPFIATPFLFATQKIVPPAPLQGIAGYGSYEPGAGYPRSVIIGE